MLISFLALVVMPLLVIVVYLFAVAEDQYASNVGFTVRNEQQSSASALMGGLSSFVGGSTSSNANVLYAFIQSQEMVERIGHTIDLRADFASHWTSNPFIRIGPHSTIEDLVTYWQHIVRVSYDESSGLIDLQVLAPNPALAQQIAQLIVAESERMINQLNEQARRDSMASTERELEAAQTRVSAAREALARFRARTQILDPQADIQGRMGVINTLQQQLATALIEHDLLLQTSNESDPRVRHAQRRVDVIRDRIAQERRNFATQDVTVYDTDYPRLIAEYESLTVAQEFADRTYTAALAARDAARSNAERQSLYLATYIRPTLAQRAEYPQRFLLSGLAAIFLLLGWSAMILIYYSLRDRG